MNSIHHAYRRDALLVFFATLLLFCIGLADRPYMTPSEARYIEIPRQMLASGDWLTPHINGVPYFEKPPLFYWMQASVMGLFGFGEFAGRFATALTLACTCLVTFAAGRLLYGRRSGLLAAGALATCILGYGLSRIAMLDAPVTLFLTCSIASFIAAEKTGKNYFYYLMYIAAALAVMTKGLLGIVIPGLVIGGWIICSGNWQVLARAKLFSGGLVFLAIILPWHMLMARTHPEFFDFYIIHEHFTRYLTSEHKRTAPWWFFIAITLVGSLPWTGLLPAALRDNPDRKFMLLWITLPLLFFSASSSKLTGYIFPIFPPIFILIGNALAKMWDAPIAPKALRINALMVSILFLAILGGYEFLLMHPDALGEKLSQKFMDFSPISPIALAPLAIMLCATLGLAIKRTSAKTIVIFLALCGATLGLTVNNLVEQFDNATIRPLAKGLKPALHDDDIVVAYDTYWQDLPVYLERNVMVVNWQGELGFGVKHYPQTRRWMIDNETFWTDCAKTKKHVYVFMKRQQWETLPAHKGCKLHVVAQQGKTLLLQKESKP